MAYALGMSAAQVAKLSYQEYLVHEERALVKHEYVDGELFAMAGGTPEHAALATAIASELRNCLKGRPCRVFSSDLRVRIRSASVSTYPDVTVVCGKLETDVDDQNAALNPVVLVEVLSAATEAYDRGDKARWYRQIPSLREYVMVSQTAARIEVHRRTPQGTWEIFDYHAGEMLELRSIEASMPVAAIYENPLAH